MLQSGLFSQDFSARSQNAAQVRAHQQQQFAQREAAWSTLGTMVGGLAGQVGTAAAGGNPAKPGSLGQGYFNTKVGAHFAASRNAALGAELAKQNMADKALAGTAPGTTISTKADMPDSGVFAGRTATPAPPKTLSSMIDAAGGKGGGMKLLERAMASKAARPSFLDKLGQYAGTALKGIAAANVAGLMGGGKGDGGTAAAAGPGYTPPQLLPETVTAGPTGPISGGASTVLPTPSTQAATTAMAGNIPVANAAAQTAGAAQAAGAAVQATQAGVATATQAVQAAQADHSAAVKNHGAGSPQAQAAQTRVTNAQIDATEAVRAHQGSVGNAGMAAARVSGNATALYDNGSTAVNLVNHMGQPVLVATVGGQTFEIDDATADSITGLTTNHENLTNSQLKRNMVMEEYERAKYDRAMQQQLNQGMNEFIYQTWMEDPYNKRNENWEAAEAQLTAMRPMLKYMDPGEFMQVIEDITEVMKMGDPDTAKSQQEQVRETLSDRMKGFINGKIKDNGYTLKHSRTVMDEINADIVETTSELAEARKKAAVRKEDTNPVIQALEKHLEDLAARTTMVKGDMGAAEARRSILQSDLMAMYEPGLGTDNLLAFADDFSDHGPVGNIVKSVLMSVGLYDPVTKTIDAEKLAGLGEEDLLQLIPHFSSKARDLGWASTPEVDDMWLQHLQQIGAEVDPQRVADIKAAWAQQPTQPTTTQPTTTQPTTRTTTRTQQQPTAQPTVDVDTLRLEDIAEAGDGKGLNHIEGLKPIVDKALSGEALSDEEYRVLTMNIAIYLRRQFVSKEDVEQLIEKWGIQVGKTPGTPQGHYPRQVM